MSSGESEEVMVYTATLTDKTWSILEGNTNLERVEMIRPLLEIFFCEIFQTSSLELILTRSIVIRICQIDPTDTAPLALGLIRGYALR